MQFRTKIISLTRLKASKIGKEISKIFHRVNKSYDFGAPKTNSALAKHNHEHPSEREYPTTIEEISVKEVRFTNANPSKTVGSQFLTSDCENNDNGTATYNESMHRYDSPKRSGKDSPNKKSKRLKRIHVKKQRNLGSLKTLSKSSNIKQG